MSKISRSLISKLSLGILLLAAPIFMTALGTLFIQSRYFIRQEAAERALSVVNMTMHRVKKYLLTVETAANANAWFIEENFCPDSLMVFSNRIVQLNRNVHSCSIAAEPDMFPQYGRYFSVYTVNEGDTVVTVREPDYEYFDRQWYKTPLAKGAGCWVDPFFNHTEGTVNLSEAVVSYCRPLRKDGRIVGVISTDLSLRLLQEAIDATEKDYPDSYFMLIGGDGRFFIHPDSTRLFRKTITSDIDPVEHADIIALGHEMISGKNGHMHVNLYGRRCHVTFIRIPSSEWSLALVCPDNEILRSYNQLAYLIAALIIIGLLVILWLCRRAVGHAVRPLVYLLGMSKKISAGHYDEEIPRTDREDAIGQLQNSFATMQQSILDHIGSIRQTAQETKKRNEELVSAMQLAEEAVRQKTLFIQNVSHQIRTPLNIILGFAQVLHESPDMSEKDLAEITGMMKYNAMHLNRMVLMLFDSSETGASVELTSHRHDQVSCNELARECINYTKDHFPGLTIRFESDQPDSLHILTNHLYLMRSLRELLYNAAKYSDGQHITMRVSQTDTSVRFTVEDVGSGLPEGSRDMIFKPFTKMDDLSEGLGLGLPLTKRHAISLGGDLLFDSSYHDGCRFTIEMPK